MTTDRLLLLLAVCITGLNLWATLVIAERENQKGGSK